MSVHAIVGAQWGDEGKGKLTDHLALQADLVVRFQGGCNAGHTIMLDGEPLALHMLPCGVLHPHVHNVLASGVALDVDQLMRELADLSALGVHPRLTVSKRAQLVMPYHRRRDGLEEQRLGAAAFGSTRVGMAPCLGDKHLKIGLTVAHLFDSGALRERLEHALDIQRVLLGGLYAEQADALEELVRLAEGWAESLDGLVDDTEALMARAQANGKRVLLEGQLGALRDPDQGIYPYVTSSSTLAGYACVGAGIAARDLRRVTAVTKAYSSAVGAGPFACELAGQAAERLRARGNEYGATTGRPRRVGYFDAVATRHGARAQGADELALTLLDVLDDLEEIPLCVGYSIDGEARDDFPPMPELARARPRYETMRGWRAPTRGARRLEDLPAPARAYVERVEELVGIPVGWLSVGREREATFATR